MNKLIQIIKNIKLKQVLTVFLAGSLLVISTACSRGNMPQAGGKAYTDTGKRAMSDTYDDYDANQSFQGGMNGYNDDRRYDEETAAKAQELVDTAKSRQTDNFGEYVENITDRTQENVEAAQREIPRNLKAKTEEAVQNVKERSQTLKENVSDASSDARQALDEATDTAQQTVEDAKQATGETAKELQSKVEDLS